MSQDRLSQLLAYLKESPEDSFLTFAVAKEYESQDQADKALLYYLKLRDSDPKYVGLYYHLAKLYEHIEEPRLSKETYEQGIIVAKESGDFHALSELNNALTNLKLSMDN